MAYRPELSEVLRHGRRVRLALLSLLVVAPVIFLSLAFGRSPAAALWGIADAIAVLLFMAIAVVTSSYAARGAMAWTPAEPSARVRERIGWHLIAAAVGGGFIARSVYAVSEIRGGSILAPNPVAESISQVAYLLFAVGIALIPWAEERGRRLPFLLDAGIILCSLFALYWVLLIGPAIDKLSSPMVSRPTLSAHVMFAFVLGFFALWLVLRDIRFELHKVAIFLSLAIVAFGLNKVARLAYLADVAGSQMTFVNITTATAFVFVALAALSRTRVASRSCTTMRLASTTMWLWQIVLPYPFIMIAVGLIVLMVATGWRSEHGLVVALCVAAALFLLMARNFQALLDSRRSYHVVLEKSRRDGLTGLVTHRAMHEILDVELQRARETRTPVAVIFADLDKFKSCNDRFGHAFGDEVLVRVARTIEGKVRADDHVGRYGGEEFVVIAPGLALSGAIELAERIRSGVARQSHPYRGEEAFVSLSVGVAAFPDIMSTGAELFEGADTAMYQAKTEGGNRIVVASRAAATFD